MAKILIVEDSPTQMEVMKRSVESLGHVAYCAEDGDKAIQMAEDLLPDLIFMDIIMPTNNGFQTTRKLTRSEKTSSIPIIIITSKDTETDKAWGLKQGAVEYIIKPADVYIIKKIIEKYIK